MQMRSVLSQRPVKMRVTTLIPTVRCLFVACPLSVRVFTHHTGSNAPYSSELLEAEELVLGGLWFDHESFTIIGQQAQK